MALWSELKRRRVFRVAAMYGVTAWVITEVSATVLPALNLPDQIVTAIVVLLIAGFPIALVLAWVFDIDRQGITRTDQQASTPPVTRSWKYRAAYSVIIIAATIGLGAFFFWRVEPVVELIESIAVLPFVNLSSDDSTDYFSDGVSEELLNLLTKVPELKVAARTSSFAYKNHDVDIRTIGRDLDVDAVLEGSVRWSQDKQRVRITAQLISTANGYHLWSETYNRELADIFAVQDDIAREIVSRVKPNLASTHDGVTDLAHAPTQNIEAYTAYLRGRALWKQRGSDALQQAIDLFGVALSHDPGFARAHSNLAAAYAVLPDYSDEPDASFYSLAVESALQALTIDGSLAEAHAVLARVSDGNWIWNDAQTGYYFATSLDPSEPTAHLWYSMHLASVGRLADALDHAEQAAQLDPDDAAVQGHLAHILQLTGKTTQADLAKVKAEDLGFVQNIPATDVAIFLDLLETGEIDQAYERVPQMVSVKILPLPALWGAPSNFRTDPRFGDLVAEIGLVDYWRRYGWADSCSGIGHTAMQIACR
jgi:TolB-like protein